MGGEVFLVLLPDFSHRPFPGALIPNECKPWNNVKHKHLIDLHSCQYRKRSTSRYVQGLLFTSFTTEVALGQCKKSQVLFPHPGLKHWQAGAATAAILTLVLSLQLV